MTRHPQGTNDPSSSRGWTRGAWDGFAEPAAAATLGAVKVMLTGATGFVGSHTFAALAAAGHRVRALVRSRGKLERVLERLELDPAHHEVVVGDMTDAAAVGEALDGCDAVVHAAAVLYGGEEVYRANVAGAVHTLGAARERGLDPILYVSTIAAMYPPPGDVITVDDPIVNLHTTYGRSKAENERLARSLQAEGAPVVTIYPAGVYGPEDPAMGETTKGLRDGIRLAMPVTETGISIVDVRDLAKMIVVALEPGRGPRRYMAGGLFMTWSELADHLDNLTGRRVRRISAAPRVLRGMARALDLAKRVVPFEYPLTHEAALMMTRFVPCDSRKAQEELGVKFRPTEATLGDSIRWLYEKGELDAKHVPRLVR